MEEIHPVPLRHGNDFFLSVKQLNELFSIAHRPYGSSGWKSQVLFPWHAFWGRLVLPWRELGPCCGAGLGAQSLGAGLRADPCPLARL